MADDETGDDVENIGQPLWSFQASYGVNDLDISVDGSYVAFCDSDSVFLMDGEGNLLWSRDLDNPACEVALSSDSSYVVVGECTAYGHDVYLFDRNGNELWRYDIQGWVGDVDISFDGSYVAALGLMGLFIFDRSGTPLNESIGWSGGQLTITDDGEFVAATYGSKNRLYLFNRQGQELWCYDEYVGDFSMTSDGRLIAVLVNDDLALLDGVGSVLWSHRPENKLYGAKISSEGSHIAAIGWCSLYLFDENGEELWSYQIDDCGQRKHLVSVAISTGGNIVAASDRLGNIYLFDGQGDLLWEYAAESYAETMVISSDGRYLAAGCTDGSVYLFGTGVGTQHPKVLTMPEYSDPIDDVAPDGELSSAEPEMTESEMIEDEAIGEEPTESDEEEPEMAIAVANIKNKDDDEISVTLLIDDVEVITETPLSPRTQHVESFILSPGDHKFEIKWWDQDTGDIYDFNVTQSFIAGETRKVNLEIAEHRAPTARVSVKSDYDEEILVDLWIDPDSVDWQTDSENVDYGYSSLGDYELKDPGEHVFLIEWDDTSTGERYETETSKYIGPGETVNVLLSIVRPVDVTVYPTNLEMYEEDSGHAFVDLMDSDHVPTMGEKVLVQRVLDAEMELYDSMWDLVVLDRDGYIFTYSESFADIILNTTGIGQEDELDEDSLEYIWALFIDQVWCSTASAMSAAGLEVPPEISSFFGSDIVDITLKHATDIEGETAKQFLDEEKAKYVMWGSCYIGLRTLVYSDDLEALTKEHQTFQTCWKDKTDDQLIAAFGTRDNVDKFITILDGRSQRFEDEGLKEYQFKSDLLGESAEGQVTRATWEASQGIDSYDSRTQLIGRRVINKFPRAMMGVNYFRSSKSIWDVIDVIGKAVPGGSEVSLLVNDVGFNGGCLATIVLAHMAMEQDIDQMSDILEELNFFSDWSTENPGEFAIFVDEYYGQRGV